MTREKEYDVHLARVCPGLEDVEDLPLLYRQIFFMENLGICIFSSFALLNRPETLELLAELTSCKTGVAADVRSLLEDAGACLEEERTLCRDGLTAGVTNNIPEFVKVLYQYFNR